MEVVDSAQYTPGECYHCGRTEGPFVDTLKEEARGRVYVCETCVPTFSSVIGLTAQHARRYDQIMRVNVGLEKDLASEQSAHDELRKAVVLTLKQGAVTRHGVIQLRKRVA
jgi:protein-arginine kinase activator protein McsA